MALWQCKWVSRVYRLHQHSIGYLWDSFTGQKTQATVWKYWRKRWQRNTQQSIARGGGLSFEPIGATHLFDVNLGCHGCQNPKKNPAYQHKHGWKNIKIIGLLNSRWSEGLLLLCVLQNAPRCGGPVLTLPPSTWWICRPGRHQEHIPRRKDHAASPSYDLNGTYALVSIDWLSMVLRLHQHSIGYTGDGFYRSKDPTNR